MDTDKFFAANPFPGHPLLTSPKGQAGTSSKSSPTTSVLSKKKSNVARVPQKAIGSASKVVPESSTTSVASKKGSSSKSIPSKKRLATTSISKKTGSLKKVRSLTDASASTTGLLFTDDVLYDKSYKNVDVICGPQSRKLQKPVNLMHRFLNFIFILAPFLPSTDSPAVRVSGHLVDAWSF